MDIKALELTELLGRIAPRAADANKGDFGRLLVVGGAPGMSGAPRMAGEAALRAGAGLVRIATHPSHAATLNVECPELMVSGIHEPAELSSLLEQATHLVVGPGLGQDDYAYGLWQTALKSEHPMVLDADGLNLLAKHPQKRNNWILTPHLGEAARLLSTDIATIEKDRPDAIRTLHQYYSGIIVLKGHGTLIYDGGKTIYRCDYGNPGMATAGMGDVLSGVLGGLMPQCDSLLLTAQIGVCLHAMAGDIAASQGQRGLLATDLFPYIQQLLN
jgi:NAD(P)H-hydrate epimerase